MSIVNTETFYQRMRKCYYFKERQSYVKSLKYIINSSLERIKSEDKSFIKIFSDEILKRRFTGNNFIFINDREEFRRYSRDIAISINNFINKYELRNINDSKEYKGRLRAKIHGISDNLNKIVYISAYNLSSTLKKLDFYSINSYIYNTVLQTDYSSIVLVASCDTYIDIPMTSDYTILEESFIENIIGSKNRIRSDYCINCRNRCGYIIINGLKRLN